jgi:hypothetical protein
VDVRTALGHFREGNLLGCHDPPVIAWQAESVERFLLDVEAMWEPGARSPVRLVHDEIVHRVWSGHAGLRPIAEVTASGDLEKSPATALRSEPAEPFPRPA